jgi:hypothetical protein
MIDSLSTDGAVREPRVEGVSPSNRGQDARDTMGHSRTTPAVAIDIQALLNRHHRDRILVLDEYTIARNHRMCVDRRIGYLYRSYL